MFFESASDILKIASRLGTAIFVIPEPSTISFNEKNVIVLQPEEKSVISIEQVRKILPKLAAKQTNDLYVIIQPAEALNAEAANALLKALEEPGDKIHFVLLTSASSMILPTVLSRASIYFLKTSNNDDLAADEKTKSLAKRMLVAKGSDLVALAEEVTKKKDGARADALEVLRVAIEMLYKTYFLTEKQVFVQKIPKYLAAYDGISQNGHIKLQIVSNLC